MTLTELLDQCSQIGEDPVLLAKNLDEVLRVRRIGSYNAVAFGVSSDQTAVFLWVQWSEGINPKNKLTFRALVKVTSNCYVHKLINPGRHVVDSVG